MKPQQRPSAKRPSTTRQIGHHPSTLQDAAKHETRTTRHKSHPPQQSHPAQHTTDQLKHNTLRRKAQQSHPPQHNVDQWKRTTNGIRVQGTATERPRIKDEGGGMKMYK